MYFNAPGSQVAILALLAAAVNAAPAAVPPHFPGVHFDGVPEASPTTLSMNITSANGTAYPTQHPKGHHDNNGNHYGEHHVKGHDNGHDKRHVDIEVEFGKFNASQLEQLHDALEHNYTLPSMNVTENTLHNGRHNLLAALQDWFRDHGFGHHKRENFDVKVDLEFSNFNASQLSQIQEALERNHTVPSLNITESTQHHERNRLLAALESWLAKTNAFGKGQHHNKRTQSSHLKIPAATPVVAEIEKLIQGLENALPSGLAKKLQSDVSSVKAALKTSSASVVKKEEEAVMTAGSPVAFPLAPTYT